jgi:hypothetical protein
MGWTVTINEGYRDALIELLFLAIPAMDCIELRRLLDGIVILTEKEIREVVSAERLRLLEATSTPSRN